ncbi:uncharacterized protein LOC143045217 [Mytilus galloprovincialis]|uniref:uncharacterized protein LOC143045217 n=1 Tax=Mytilus galloprovincialis TaxID=29158 RepID=UPI003F7C8AA0
MLSCRQCEKNRCQSTPPQIHEHMINGLLNEVNKPITKAAKFGQKVGQLVNNLERKLNSWSEDITWKFNGWLKQAEKHANNVKNGIVDTGKKIGKGAENTGKKVWGGIKSIFGKRSTRHLNKRCANSCPQCDRLNTNKNKDDKVILSICGSNFVTNQKKTTTRIKDLKALYSFILSKNSIVLKVEYEKKSVLFTGGKVEFKTSFITFQTGKTKQRFKLPGMFVISDINRMSMKISQEVFSRMF